MQLDTLFAELGLSPNTSRREIRRAFRRLALRYHPDHNADDPAARRKFLRVTRAYHLLCDHITTIGAAPLGVCSVCTGLKRLYRATDGRNCCFDCLLGRRRWLLPHPWVQLARFYGVMACWLGAAVCLLRGAVSGQIGWHAAAMTFVLVGLIQLACGAIWICWCDDPSMPLASR